MAKFIFNPLKPTYRANLCGLDFGPDEGQVKPGAVVTDVGMNRDDAHRYALEGAEQDAVAAQNARSYYAEVTASYEGQEMGVASIGFEVSERCGEADADEMLDTYDLVGEAVHDAWKALAVAMGVDARLYEEVV